MVFVRSIQLLALSICGVLIIGCGQNEDMNRSNEVDEQHEQTEVSEEQPEVSEDQTLITGLLYYQPIDNIIDDSSMVVNVTIEELVDVVENKVSENLIHKLSKFRATVNDYYYNKLDDNDEIVFFQFAAPDWMFEEDPLLEIGESYTLFLREDESPELGHSLFVSGGPLGRFNIDGANLIRQVSHPDEKEFEVITEEQLLAILDSKLN